MGTKLDTYNFKARLAPLLLVILPAALAVGVWLPVESDALKMSGSLGASAALTFLMIQLGRDLGKRKQAGLFASWDGKPTTRMLRHRDSTLDAHTKARYHRKLQALLPEIKVPSPRAEKGNPEAADAVYESCVRHLLEATRDKEEHALIFEANVSYGFRRNFWGMKPTEIASSAIGLLSSAANIAHGYIGQSPTSAASIGSVAICGLLLAWWPLRITPAWVKLTGEAYAERLLSACETLSAQVKCKGADAGKDDPRPDPPASQGITVDVKSN